MGKTSLLDAGFVFAPYVPINLSSDVDNAVLERMSSYFAARPVEILQADLQRLVEDDTTDTRKLYDALWAGTWEIGSAVLRHPQLAPEVWGKYAWLDPDSALQNPALPLWLLENPLFLTGIEGGVLRILLTSPRLTGAVLMQLIDCIGSATGNKAVRWLEPALWGALKEAAGLTSAHRERIVEFEYKPSRRGYAKEQVHHEFYATLSLTSFNREEEK